MNDIHLRAAFVALACLAASASLAAPTDYVLPEMGTANTRGDSNPCCISYGNLYPIAARPWGAGGWTPQTCADNSARWFYDYNDRRIFGIRHTHQPSPWIGDYGAWTFLPVTGEPGAAPANRFSWFSHHAETLKPHLLKVYLADFDTTVELTPTLHGAATRLTFPETAAPGLVVNPFPGGEVRLAADGRGLVGTSVFITRNTPAKPAKGVSQGAKQMADAPLHQHFTIMPDRAIADSRILPDGALYVRFGPTRKGDRVTLRIATSMISPEQAAVNLGESAGRGFDELAAAAEAEWNARLRVLTPASRDIDRLRTFYTCLFRTMLFPMTMWERTTEGKVVHWSPSTGEVRDGHYYGGTGFWDTFRALYPLLNLLAPDISGKMMDGLANCWRECGWLPEWSAPGLCNCMIGNNSASVVADAWLAGIRGSFAADELWAAVVHGANNAHPTMNAVGRCGVDHYNALGYVPRDVGIRESAARTLEYAYDDWCIAALGRALGRPADEVAVYEKRAHNWRNVFDPARRIACGRNKDGSFNANFNPFAWGVDFTEGCALHYTWSVFHDVPGLVEAMGGPQEFERRLDEIFALPPTVNCSGYGRIIHEMREMQVMDFGQYAHGNQPIQHMIYLYDWVGATKKAQIRAREVMDRLYRPTPDGYCGDEDNGQTSAWYVWSALGMYPVCPASGEYALGAPLFDEIGVSLPNGKTLTIRAKGAAARRTFGTVRLNGETLKAPFVPRKSLAAGGELVFE